MSKKENGTGSIRQRKNGSWEGQYWVNGKRKSLYGKTYQDVRIRLNTVMVEVMQNEYHEASGITLEEWLVTWLSDYAKPTVRHSTYLTYHAYCHNHVIPLIGSKRLKDLNVEVLQQFFNEKSSSGRLDGERGGLSPKSLQNMRNMLNLIFKQAILNELISNNPIPAIKLSRVEPVDKRVLSEREQEALEQVIMNSLNPVAGGIIIALYTGLRIGELLGLQWQDISLDKAACLKVKRILVRQEKPDKDDKDYEILTEGEKTALMLGRVKTFKGYRTVYLPDIVAEMFQGIQKYQKELINTFGSGFNPRGFVFCNEQGMVIEPRTYQDVFYSYVKAAGIPRANFHCLRHTFATRAIEKSMDLNTLADTLGHAQPSTTLNMYGHSLDEQKQREMAKFNKKPNGQGGTAVRSGGTGAKRRTAKSS